jgi:hypothetical protein
MGLSVWQTLFVPARDYFFPDTFFQQWRSVDGLAPD